MKNLNKKVRGITLVALVVTIIVLLILAGVAINLTVGNKGLFKRAQDAANTWMNVSRNEEDEIGKFVDAYDKILNGVGLDGDGSDEDNKNTIKKAITEIDGNETKNVETKDKNGNKIIIPAGFKPVNPEEDVTKGIVIEDISANDEVSKGNQYIWISVTHVNGEKINTIKDSNNIEHTIELARYTFNEDGTINEKVIDGSMISDGAYDVIEETETEHIVNKYTNIIAKDINKFKESIKDNGGYYITRYEAGDQTTMSDRTNNSNQNIIPVFKNNKITYNCITQPNSAILMRNLYSNQHSNYESDLVNSYAWDTAIVFIQEFSGDGKYSRQQRLQNTLAKTGQATDGIKKDVRCNIYDMSGNVMEWSTETHKTGGSSHVVRRGLDWYNPMYDNGASNRNMAGIDINSTIHGFRRSFICELIYVNGDKDNDKK